MNEWEWQTASSRKLFIGNVTEIEYCIQSIKGQIIRALTACMIFWAFVALGKICNSILKEYANMLKLYLLIYSNFFNIEYFWRMVLYGWSIAEKVQNLLDKSILIELIRILGVYWERGGGKLFEPTQYLNKRSLHNGTITWCWRISFGIWTTALAFVTVLTWKSWWPALAGDASHRNNSNGHGIYSLLD